MLNVYTQKKKRKVHLKTSPSQRALVLQVHHPHPIEDTRKKERNFLYLTNNQNAFSDPNEYDQITCGPCGPGRPGGP